MLLCNIDKIDTDGGDYLLLVDYGIKGIYVSDQSDDLSDLIKSYHGSSPWAIVKLVRVKEVAE